MSFGLSRGKPIDTGCFGIAQRDLPCSEDGRPVKFDPRMWFDAECDGSGAEARAPLEIEIGSGKGTFLVQQAQERPGVNFLGIEWAGEFYRYAADRMRRRNLNNVRILRADASEFVRLWCADEIAAVIHLYFSDPWPKKRHRKRRVVQEQTLIEFHRILEPGGEVRLVTDHDALWAWYEQHVSAAAHLFERVEFERTAERAGSAEERVPSTESASPLGTCSSALGTPEELVGTNFERKYARQGRSFHAMTLVKR